jgi:hypothetical protein
MCVGIGNRFGFAALKSVLIEEEVYRESCTKEELVDNLRVCYMQDLRYYIPELSYIIVSLPYERPMVVTDTF